MEYFNSSSLLLWICVKEGRDKIVGEGIAMMIFYGQYKQCVAGGSRALGKNYEYRRPETRKWKGLVWPRALH